MEVTLQLGALPSTERVLAVELVSRLEMKPILFCNHKWLSFSFTTQVRCKNRRLCSTGGVRVILTDLNKSNTTDLVLSPRAFTAMARDGTAQELKRLGILDVEYKR